MSITKSQNARVMSEEAIQYLCKCINLVNSLPTSVIDNLHLADNLTFSSTKIDRLLTTLKEDCNKYTDSIIANFSRLELRVVTDEADMNEHNKLYLIKKNGETSYSQYVIVTNDSGVDEKILLGTCDISMTDYLKITDADSTYCKKTDFNSLVTEVDKVKTTLGTKVNKTDIVDNLTSTDADKPLSANQGNVLDTKIGHKIDNDKIVTTIDNTSTDSELPTAKSVWDKVKDSNIKTFTTLEQLGLVDGCTVEEIFLALPNDSYLEIGCHTNSLGSDLNYVQNVPIVDGDYGILSIRKKNRYRFAIEYKLSGGGAISKNELYIGNLKGLYGTELTWRKVCTTSVEDVAKTNITSRVVNATLGSDSGVSYSVKNGICYVQFTRVTTTATSSGQYILSTGTLPPVNTSLSNGHYPVVGAGSTNGLVVVESNTGGVRYYGYEITIYTTISYPVKES